MAACRDERLWWGGIAARLFVPAFWGTVAIIAMWLAMLFDGIFGGDIASNSPPDTTIQVRPDGTIFVRVGDYQRCCGDETPQQWQTRSYEWTGHGFTQSGGPTAFPINPAVTETSMTAGQLVLGPATGGVRHGTLNVTVTYSYGAIPAHLTLDFMPPAGLRSEGAGWPLTYTLPHEAAPAFAVDLPTPARGTSKTYTFAFSGPTNVTSTGTDFMLHLYAARSANNFLSEANGWNNGQQVTVRTVG